MEQLGIQWVKLLTQLVDFTLVLLVLWRLAYRPVFAMLELRRQKIIDGLANAEKIKAEQAREAAARVREIETQKAIAAAEQIIAKARAASAQDHAQMLADLKREVGRLVVQTTTTVTGKILTTDDQRRLAEETSKQLAA
jgi:F-type H+-transporting ATPase subunit b